MSGNAKLTLIVDGTLSVYGGAAGKGGNSAPVSGQTRGTGGAGGTGGFAGIYVPNGSVLTITGNGTVCAYGGDAGDGGDILTGAYEAGGGGGGGAGAGIGGNGGDGGRGGQMGTGTAITPARGMSGSAGTQAGIIYLYGNGTIKAYGGAGGSGGKNELDAGGAGGYPAAGIGGGGAGAGGGNYCAPGSGYTGAAVEGARNVATYDGVGGVTTGATNTSWAPGAGYFSVTQYGEESQRGTLGGGENHYTPSTESSYGGGGGTGGAGNSVYKSSAVALTVANGSYKTATKQVWGSNPTPIYAQSGYDLALLRKAGVTKVDARTKSALESELGSKGKSSSITPTGLAGVGSGAGYTESSNEYEGACIYLLG